MKAKQHDKVWSNRLNRLRRRTRLALSDLQSNIRWHFAGGRQFFTQYSAELINSHRWCFIVGCNNSGTSLLQSLLLQTGQVSTFPAEGQTYTRVLRRSERRGYERVWSEFAGDLTLSEGDATANVPRLLHDWMTALVPPLRYIILEKTPANVVRMNWLQNAFPDSYFIGLVRNGYAVSEGIRRKGRKPLERGARHWNKVNALLLENSSGLDNYIEIRYEDLVEVPDATLSRLVSFLGLGKVGSAESSLAISTIRGDHMKIRNFNHESIARLTADDLKIVNEHAGAMLDHFGYTSTST